MAIVKVKLKNSDEFTLIDKKYEDVIKSRNWFLSNNGYVISQPKLDGKFKTITLNRYIYLLEFGTIPEEMEVDHIDGNKLNNCLSNLRIVTRSQNNVNKPKVNCGCYDTPISHYKGVTTRISKYTRKDGTIHEYKRYRAQIYIPKTGQMKQRVFSFTPEGELAAAKWYDEEAKRLYGEFAKTNF